MFARHVGNPRLSDITPETLENYLDGRKISPVAKDAARRCLSRFFTWTIERPRRWLHFNPASSVRVARPQATPPAILTVPQVERLLRIAETEEPGIVAWFALGLFGGLRPTEAERLQWGQVNFDDGEIRLEAAQVKTGRSRVVTMNNTLRAWLEAVKALPIAYSRRAFRRVISEAGISQWPHDALRHTAASHAIRKAGSYGRVAEEFGNSEAILKRHYQGRVSSADTKAFYGIKPSASNTKGLK